jgi:hydroxyacylglutathione hydrolase
VSDSPVVPVVDQGLGNTAYLVDLGESRALVVDASLDLRAVRAAVDKRGLKVAFAADTHLHADFVSGARQLAGAEGARVLASAAGGRQFEHIGLHDGDEVDLGGLRLRALSTPGHTDEHVAFLLLDDDRPIGVFTGGSLLVGSAARTDLVDPARVEELARAQYRSLCRLAALSDEVAVWPTHGAGSFCSAPVGIGRTSSIGREKATNPLLRAAGEDEFVAQLLGSLGSFPPYFLRLAETNRRGPRRLDEAPTLHRLQPTEAWRLVRDGAWLVDTRPVVEYASVHVAGSLSIPLRDAFATWLGWLVPPSAAVVVLRGRDQDPDEIVWQATKIGYDRIVGELSGGIDAAAAVGVRTRRTQLVPAGALIGPLLIDVRQHSEFAAGHVPGARLVELGAVAGAAASLPVGPVAVMCGHGERAMTAASLLERAGRGDVAVVVGGPDRWAAANGIELERGP